MLHSFLILRAQTGDPFKGTIIPNSAWEAHYRYHLRNYIIYHLKHSPLNIAVSKQGNRLESAVWMMWAIFESYAYSWARLLIDYSNYVLFIMQALKPCPWFAPSSCILEDWKIETVLCYRLNPVSTYSALMRSIQLEKAKCRWC